MCAGPLAPPKAPKVAPAPPPPQVQPAEPAQPLSPEDAPVRKRGGQQSTILTSPTGLTQGVGVATRALTAAR